MTTPMIITLDDAVAAARRLPESTQSAIAVEILERVQAFGRSQLIADQQAEVRRRLAEPRQIADEAEVRQFFERHGVKR